MILSYSASVRRFSVTRNDCFLKTIGVHARESFQCQFCPSRTHVLATVLDLDIRTKTNRSQTLYDTIEANRKEVTKLEAKADKKRQDFYTIYERGDWQEPMFFAMTAYIYRIDEGCSSASKPFSTLPILASEVVAANTATFSGITSHTPSSATRRCFPTLPVPP